MVFGACIYLLGRVSVFSLQNASTVCTVLATANLQNWLYCSPVVMLFEAGSPALHLCSNSSSDNNNTTTANVYEEFT